MTDRADVDAAVAAGVLTAEQGSAFSSFLEARLGGSTETEGVRFARGFHDVFITLGVGALLLGVALAGDFFNSPLMLASACLVLSWGLAEFLTGRRKLVLPSILLAGAVGLSGAAVAGLGAVDLLNMDQGAQPLIAAIGGWFSALVFYLRFKLPFAMAVSVAGILAFGLSLLALFASEWFEANVLLSLLGAGVVTFAIAMGQDLADPARKTLKADNAFWLHLMAAPLIVHALIGLVVGNGADAAEATQGAEIGQSLVMIAVITALAIVALLIDRRAMLVAGLGTLGYAVGVIITAANLDVGLVLSLTLVLIGTAVLLLGTGWQRTRRVLLRLVPQGLAQRLPPPHQPVA